MGDANFLKNKQDRRIRDRKAAGQTVFVSKGPLKGYKGKIVVADEVQATVQIFAKNNKSVTLPREMINFIQDDSAPIRSHYEGGPMAVSFDEAMNQEFVNVPVDEDGNPLYPTQQHAFNQNLDENVTEQLDD